jgi:hypothetical protein
MRRQLEARRWSAIAAALAAAGVVLAVGLSPVVGASASPRARTSQVTVPVFTRTLKLVGSVDLASYGPPPTTEAPSQSSWRVADNAVVAHRPGGSPVATPQVSPEPVTTTQVAKESGFVGITGPEQAAANGGLDLAPPDQGLCASPAGDIGEFINNAFTVYSPSGSQLLPIIPSYAIFKQPSTDFFSDPRCYYDAPTGRWFLQEFIVGTVKNGKAVSPSVQFLAVSDDSDPTGNYNIWAFDTTDSSAPGCPCFGDYDNLGADANGIYIATDEFGVATSAYNGVIVYAVSKELLEDYSSTGIRPVLFGYRIKHDTFGTPYILAPTSTPQGGHFAPNTEYFVESNANQLSDHRLMVYALGDTSDLAAPAPPPLYRTLVTTESYAFPPDAKQASGPRPLGKAVQEPEGQLQADFDAVMEPTYVNGVIYGQLDTATSGGNDAAAWFQLTPTLSGTTLSVSVARQGYVAAAKASLIYPYTAIDSSGNGYMLFALSGKNNYPSAAYVTYGPTGPSGPVRIAASGADPDDGFTCYAAYVGPSYGGCRWGDYSMGVAAGHRIYMATEMIPPTSRDYLTNWGTYVWSAPPAST